MRSTRRHSQTIFDRDLRLALQSGLGSLQRALSVGGFGIEVAYRSTSGFEDPLMNVGWRCDGKRHLLAVENLREDARTLDIPVGVMDAAVASIVTGSGYVTIRLGEPRRDVFVQISKCRNIESPALLNRLFRSVSDHVVRGNQHMATLAETLRAKLVDRTVKGVISGWEIVAGQVTGRSLYVNCGFEGRWELWAALEQRFQPKGRRFIEDLLHRPMFQQPHGTLYFKASDDGSASIHFRGLKWEEADAISLEYAQSEFLARLRDLYDEPPDILCLAGKADGDRYCTAYFQHFVPFASA